MSESLPMIEMRNVSKHFGNVIALNDISLKVHAGEVMCLLGDNGAGKSTLIKTLSGVHKPSHGQMFVEGREIRFKSPAYALDAGIATVFQDLAMIPLMSITRNFFMGREPTVGWGPFKRIDWHYADRIAMAEMAKIGIDVRDPSQPVGTLSGGERQCVAIARAVYFGAKVLILDEPTSALGVKQASVVLRYIAKARADGLAVIFITHNVHHAYPVADAFTLLKRGSSLGTFRKDAISREEVLNMMAGGAELESLDAELAEFQRDQEAASDSSASSAAHPGNGTPLTSG
ncbi:MULTISPECIES: ATP-binding cassette domain-containing protein [unclassified Modicisalibacter]|uniref:ATP-binding cassette domain-containing protein n=1 Tax=unclassified Modicisalibacter TaxID=2679913 RepID=UPI001CCCCBC3|nr:MULTISPECIES: ATP-binding cassette domain-containing protein [unclassified Modicisalibacter]MBZ9559395.1 sugar ABC transporter ATP-binding protein [Modicisalibacter sp. R2A 31.J]MBZ9576440.1 sugar ABC transporter ATP-binding protein [Modicisalibacter sp. MOD 31.J]